MKEVREYVENGVTPEGLTQPIQDPDAHSDSEGEGERETEKANDTTVADTVNDKPPPDKETKSNVS